ncbi:MAG: hypothetical protein COA42_12245 [Alteromonadaceae bacterium]|nr:MAG: hypothetical protein COA42_12245 [Alteromonadaceae bacterium]
MQSHIEINPDNYRHSLLSLPLHEKIISLSVYIKSKLLSLLPTTIDDFDNHHPFQELVDENNISKEDSENITHELFFDFKKMLDLQFYSDEHKIDTIDKLANFLASELECIWHPKTPKQIEKIETEPKNWPWDLPKSPPEQKVKRPIIFLLSSPRSGSTISRLILGAHPQLFSPPELHLLPFSSMGERESQINKHDFQYMRAGPIEALIELHGWDWCQANDFYTQQVKNDLPVSEFYQYLIESCGDRILVDKTPTYAYHPKWLTRAEDVFENAKYIFLTRHPYGMINSFVKLRMKYAARGLFGQTDDNPWRLAEKWWYAGNKNITDFFENIPESKRRFIRYEDVVSNTESIFSEICHFLNIDFSSNILNPYDNLSQGMLNGAGDPNIGLRNKIDASLHDAWKKTPPPQQLSEETQALAEAFQYSLP